ncbi:MAG: hypothetical protein QXF32_00540 [Candidatus Thermoplasmatota archaeon]
MRKKIHKKYRMGLLNAMLWGGVAMLAVEHIAHKEIVPYPPFLTAGLNEVLPEMLKIGLPMTLLIFFAWAIIVAMAELIPKKKELKSE